ncbi:preprotein translocase subunit SecE [Mycolicibacterium brumae]|uniref:preprotein translocase subunit SecE n=1 Tax=Mycolicibacterium brumae TaxID=85968 RepID=UPI000B29CD51|nr:hypothetical protein MBRU_05145 [Mycolicibacterium brumae DSM 44177]
MSDDRGDADGEGTAALSTTPGITPPRPTGKRTRRRALTADVDTESAEVETTEVVTDDAAADDKAKDKPKKKKKAKSDSPSRNPIVFVINYLKQVVAELRKVIWPNRKQMVSYTSVVLVFLVFMVTLISLADVGLAKLVLMVFG